MKVALLYSGISNITPQILANHKQYIHKLYDCDIFLSTYENSNAVDLLKPLKYDIEEWDTIKKELEKTASTVKHKRPETKPINTLSMFYKINRCFNLVNNYSEYDLFVRLRLDIIFDSELKLEINNKLNVPKGGDYVGGLLDSFGYGLYHIMKTYCDVYQNIPSFIKNREIIFHPESMLRHHCNKNNIPISRFKFNIFLRNQLLNNENYK